MTETNAMEIVKREIMRRMDGLVPALLQAAIEGKPVEQVPYPSGPARPASADARARAGRTLLGGLVTTMILAVLGALGAAIAAPEFDVFSWGSWSGVVQTLATVAVMSVVSFVQRLVSPPKE
ncbi:hypothetical protein [Prescottella equi]